MRTTRWLLGVTLGLPGLAGGPWGCAEEDNQDPQFSVRLEDTSFRVNTPGKIDIFASDPDDDRLEYDFTIEPEPPTQTEGIGGRPQVQRLDNAHALFTWTPGNGDTGVYDVTFTVTDGRKGSVSERIQLRVVDSGVAGSATLRFVEPPGAGMAVNLSQTPCVEFEVKVKSESVAEADVLIEIAAPAPAGGTLLPVGAGKTKRFSWCPTDEQLDRSLTHTVTFTAGGVGGDAPVNKRFLIRFKRTAGAGCPGAAPTIQHASPGVVDGQLNYELEATISDDVGFKSPPVLAFVVDPENDPRETAVPDTSGWQLVEMSRAGAGDRWRASVPNLGLAAGQEAAIFYVIIATDDDDAEGTRCDHTTESPVFMMTARGGGGGGQTYGFCARCVSDAQCGGAEDRCVSLQGDEFCGVSCAQSDCGPGQQCLVVESVDGTSSPQCLPVDLNCGQLCVPDANEGGAGNDDVANATAIAPGSYDNLSACQGDLDFYRVPIAAGQSVTARIRFDAAAGDLDLGMALPGDSTEMFPYVSASADNDVEEVSEPCVPSAGDAIIAVQPYNEAENPYRLEIEVGPGACDVACTDDAYEAGVGNDTADDFVAVDAPFEERGLQICRGDEDYYGFVADAGEIIRVSASFVHDAGNLDLNLFRSNGLLIGTAVGYRDTEIIEVEAPTDDIFILAVFGATRSVSNRYDLSISKSRAMMCETTAACPPGTYCGNAGCIAAACAGFDECQGQHACVAARAGLDPAAGGGECVPYCATDRDCRANAGYACKRFEDFTMACASAGAARAGERCGSYADCAGDQVCFAVPGGYCAAGGCAGDLPCPVGTVCGTLGGFPACLKACQGDGDCRVGEGYACRAVAGGLRACTP